MLLFVISFLLVFTSSYFITSLIAPKKSILGFLYLFILAFAQIVFTFELLSLFSAIKVGWVLLINLIFFAVSGFIWNYNLRPKWSLDFSDFKNKFVNSLKLDKSLIVLLIGYLVFIFSALFLAVLLPVTNADAQGYHVARSLFWVMQGNLNHFQGPDIRALCLPINSELLYSWIFLFIKKDVCIGLFSFTGYVLSVISIYNILGYLGYCVRKRLWVILILSSFASVLVQASSSETDIIIAGLVSSSILFFWYALKTNKISPVFMASLAFALAMGTKTPAILAIPGVGLLLLYLCYKYKNFKPLLVFIGLGALNFLIFSSYNYILNYIHFSNFMGSESFMAVSKNYYGFKGMIANFIKHLFRFFDFTGFTWSKILGTYILNTRDYVLSLLKLDYVQDGLYSTYAINNFLLEPIMGAGILGFALFLPCLLWALIKPVFKFKSQKTRELFVFAAMFIINLLLLSYLIVYMSFSVRFIMFFMVLSSPILLYSYFSKINPLKYIVIFFALFYLTLVSTHLWPRPFVKIVKILAHEKSIHSIRKRALCSGYEKKPMMANSACALAERIEKSYAKDNKILIFFPSGDNIYIPKLLEFKGYKVDFGRMENIKNIDLNQYNIIISSKEGQNTTVVEDYEKRKDELKLVGNEIVLNKKELVPCLYSQNPNVPYKYKGKLTPPYEVRCALTMDFLKEKKLDLVSIAGVIKPNAGEYNYYMIYRNTNLPLKLLKGADKNAIMKINQTRP